MRSWGRERTDLSLLIGVEGDPIPIHVLWVWHLDEAGQDFVG